MRSPQWDITPAPSLNSDCDAGVWVAGFPGWWRHSAFGLDWKSVLLLQIWHQLHGLRRKMCRFQITPCLGRSYNSSAGSSTLNHSSSDQRLCFCVFSEENLSWTYLNLLAVMVIYSEWWSAAAASGQRRCREVFWESEPVTVRKQAQRCVSTLMAFNQPLQIGKNVELRKWVRSKRMAFRRRKSYFSRELQN